MQVSDIATASYQEVGPGTGPDALWSALDATDVDGVLVTGPDRLGVVTRHSLDRSRAVTDANAAAIATPVPALERSDDVSEAARLLAANRTPVAPVVENDELVGCVTRDAVLEAAADTLGGLTVDDVWTGGPVTVAPNATLGEARRDLLENDASELPVVTYGGALIGIVTRSDVARGSLETAGPERDRDPHPKHSVAVADVMGPPVESTTTETPVTAGVETMLRTGDDSLVVSPEGDDSVAGILTKRDVLAALAGEERSAVDLRIENPRLLSTTAREDVAARLEATAAEHPDCDVSQGVVRLEVTDQRQRERPVVRCVARVGTGDGWLAKTAESDGAENALSLAIHRLERELVDAPRISE